MQRFSGSFSIRLRAAWLLAFAFYASAGFAQPVLSYDALRSTFNKQDSVSVLSAESFSSAPIDVLSDSTQAIERILDRLLVSGFKSSRHDTLKESSILTELSVFSIHRWMGYSFSKPERIARIKRRLYRIFYSSQCRFGMLSVFSFSIPVVKPSGACYYNRKGTAGGFNLYEGRKKPVPTKEDPEPEETPLPLITAAELSRVLQKELRRSGCYKELRSGLISYAGYAVIPDRRTFFRRGKRPQVRIVVIFGSKRLQMVKQKKAPPVFTEGDSQ